MSRRRQNDSALPTHGWLFLNRFRDYLAYAFVLFFIIIFIAVWTIRYTINRNCDDYYKRDIKILKYWIHVEAGSTDKECPNPHVD